MKKITVILLGFLVLSGGFAELARSEEESQEKLAEYRMCLDKRLDDLKLLSEKEAIETLDGKMFPLSVFEVFRAIDPRAIPPHKFYYWESEVVERKVGSTSTHLIRIYWSPLSICDPAMKKEKQKKFGDFAEIYNIRNGKPELLGFALYLGLIDDKGDGVYSVMQLPKKEKQQDV